MTDETTSGDQVRLYALLVDQLQRYNSIVWQVPTALIAADVVALQQLEHRPVAMCGVSAVSVVLTFAYYRMIRQQSAIIRATRSAEASLRSAHGGFVPEFSQLRLSARWLVVVVLALFNVGFAGYALRGLSPAPAWDVTPLPFWCMVLGYAVAIVGSLLLFLGTPEDVGMGRVPRLPGDEATQFFANQDRAIGRRRGETKLGFALLLFGMLLQLLGVVLPRL